MKGKKIRSRIALLLASFFILINIIGPITVIAASPWSGNTWEGQSWQGNTWEGTPWKGQSWQGNSWEGTAWESDSWTSEPWSNEGGQGGQWTANQWSNDSWQGSQWNNNPWQGSQWNNPNWNPWSNIPGGNGQSWSGSSFSGNGWNNPNWQGNQWNGTYGTGNPWDGNYGTGYPWQYPAGVSGNPWSGSFGPGNPWEISSGSGSSFSGNAFNSNEFTAPFSDVGYYELGKPSTVYEWQKFLGKDMLGGVISVVDSENGFTNGQIGRSLLFSSMKMATKQNNEAVSGAFNLISNGKNLVEGTKRANELMNYLGAERAVRGATEVSRLAGQTAPAFKAVSRLGAAGAAIGTVFSAVDTVQNFSKGDALSGVGSLGDTLMGAGVVALAFPGGQAIGAGLVATGALLSVGAGAVKMWRNREKIISDGKKIINSGAKALDGAKKGLGNMFNKVTSFFGG
ncbi:hypothetical protein [Bacillus solitudinis]|uniref:hypothetical protein n=1 Tax=Bacillus solitudinis TaxID=2014074 RepID=UPI000C241508|nr:hypothetical protein [Bacillus solitudinis]